MEALFGDQVTLWFVVVSVVLYTIATVATCVIFFAVFDGGPDDVADVQRFSELTEEARRVAPLEGEATASRLERFKAKKDEARRALWASRGGRPVTGSRRPGPRAQPGQQVSKGPNVRTSPSHGRGEVVSSRSR
jgi:hypothetical protein